MIQGKISRSAEAKRIVISSWTLDDCLRKFEEGGTERLKGLRTWTRYPEKTKLCAVKAVLNEGESKLSVIKRYVISDPSVLNKWISKYTSGDEIKSTGKGNSKSQMIKGRKTDYKERIENVQDTIAHGFNYDKAIEKYQVSYQQVYSWVRKYQSLGEGSLKDRRGRKKDPEELTELDRLKLKNKKLQAEKEHLEIEGAVQKKLQEIRERFKRWRSPEKKRNF
ncbi:helix-turn-helix domain-containing protein [Enterococcus hirae]|nr:helix-turn-helix domain-containing protein [Enterococcus hirae]